MVRKGTGQFFVPVFDFVKVMASWWSKNQQQFDRDIPHLAIHAAYDRLMIPVASWDAHPSAEQEHQEIRWAEL